MIVTVLTKSDDEGTEYEALTAYERRAISKRWWIRHGGGDEHLMGLMLDELAMELVNDLADIPETDDLDIDRRVRDREVKGYRVCKTVEIDD